MIHILLVCKLPGEQTAQFGGHLVGRAVQGEVPRGKAAAAGRGRRCSQLLLLLPLLLVVVVVLRRLRRLKWLLQLRQGQRLRWLLFLLLPVLRRRRWLY
jgi:hypothetical protein